MECVRAARKRENAHTIGRDTAEWVAKKVGGARMRRLLAALVALAALSTSCLGGSSNVRTVLVDYKHDEYASSFYLFFPKNIDAHPGDTVTFHQSWSGEPHSVTMGTEADALGVAMKPYFKIFDKEGYEGLPQEPPKDIMKFEKELPPMVNDDGKVNQAGAQPCFLKSSLPNAKKGIPCTKAQQRQPAFDGTYRFYNSGFIPYEGENGDTYTMKIAPDAKPGTHFFYCNYHYEFMSGFLHIKPKTEKIASPSDVAKEAQKEIDKNAKPLLSAFRHAEGGTYALTKDEVQKVSKFGMARTVNGKHYFKGRFAGLGADGVDNALINEFLPKNITVKAGKKITWAVIGSHTISFNVPKYFPIYTVAKSGKVIFNPKIIPPAGGAPDISKLGEEHQDGPPVINASTWNGKGFWSSGYIESDDFAVYNLRISKPGTYKFACLIHPPMVGTLKVVP